MISKNRLLGIIITGILLFTGTGSLAATTPTEDIRSTIEKILNILRDKNLGLPANKAKRRTLIRTVITGRFDFEEMAKRSLGRHWRDRSPDEKREFVSIFSELLEDSYIGKIESYTDEKITYDKETLKGGGRYADVGTTIVTKDVTIPIEYSVFLKDAQWFVYDVTIEGVSFISTYRSQYNKIILTDSYDALIKNMKAKLDEVNTLRDRESPSSR